MSNFFNAFEVSPVPQPGPDAVAPEPFRGIYGMPMFVTVPTSDLENSVDFWTKGLGFFELFSIPGTLVHLRRWAFQDVLLVAETSEGSGSQSAMTVSFACVLNQLDQIAQDCNALVAGSASAPADTPWSTRDVRVSAPDGVTVILTAARQLDPSSVEAAGLAEIGIVAPSEGQDAEHAQ